MAKSNNERKNGSRKSGKITQIKNNGSPSISTSSNTYSFKDVQHADGSKTYQTFNYGYQTIKNPELVKLIEHALKVDGTGFFYAADLQNFVDSGKDIYNEIVKALRVLN